MAEITLRLAGIERSFVQGGKTLRVLTGLDLTIRSGEIVALVGPSGSGKSTLLHIAGLLERPDAGQVEICGIDGGTARDRTRTLLRRNRLGFVYQYHHLLPEFTALENVAMPLIIDGQDKKRATGRARDLLDRMGLSDRVTHLPGQLSGGEQQRVAISRALANEPDLLLADEPTGNLDPHTAESVFDMLIARVRDAGLAALIATHNPDLAARMDRTVTLTDGRLEVS